MTSSLKIVTRHKPRKLVYMARKYGDKAFDATLDTMKQEIFKLLPDVAPFGYEVSHGSAIMLSGLVCVGPHTDPSVGVLNTSHSVFGLLSGGKNLQLFVRDNDKWDVTQMRPGDWVLFEDDKEHMVLADTKWTGVAVQVKQRAL